MPSFTLLRMLVERYAHGDASAMTWVRFQSILRAVPRFRRFEIGGAESHEERIARQREQTEGEEW